MSTATNIWIDLIPVNLPDDWEPDSSINGTFSGSNYGLTWDNRSIDNPGYTGGYYRTFSIQGTANVSQDSLCTINFTTRWWSDSAQKYFDTQTKLIFTIYY
jgi:hypothetical protein